MKAIKFLAGIVVTMAAMVAPQYVWLQMTQSWCRNDPTVGGAVCVVWAGGAIALVGVSLVALVTIASMLDQSEDV